MFAYSEYLQEFVYKKQGLQSGGKIKDDPRVNKMGYFLRKYWLDELPMLINLLKGEIKIFGVRPISGHYLSLFPLEFQEYRRQFKPGLIPPVYVEIPETLEDVVAIERRYLKAYERRPLQTDIKYFYQFVCNVIFKKVRSN
jgi:lipopolysaccharide/colanic/teichoic acid biosynthesis glycosyltransferase